MDEWRCLGGTDVSDGDFCIPLEHKCDKFVDCTDGSDENGACDYLCAVGEFACANGTLKLEDGEHGRGFCLQGHTR